MSAWRLPAIYQAPEFPEEGELIGYGPRLTLMFRQLARQEQFVWFLGSAYCWRNNPEVPLPVDRDGARPAVRRARPGRDARGSASHAGDPSLSAARSRWATRSSPIPATASGRRRSSGRPWRHLLIAECYFFAKPVKWHLNYPDIAAHRDHFGAKRIVLTHMSREMLAHADAVRRMRVRRPGHHPLRFLPVALPSLLGQTSRFSFRTAALAARSAGVPSNTIRPWPIT